MITLLHFILVIVATYYIVSNSKQKTWRKIIGGFTSFIVVNGLLIGFLQRGTNFLIPLVMTLLFSGISLLLLYPRNMKLYFIAAVTCVISALTSALIEIVSGNETISESAAPAGIGSIHPLSILILAVVLIAIVLVVNDNKRTQILYVLSRKFFGVESPTTTYFLMLAVKRMLLDRNIEIDDINLVYHFGNAYNGEIVIGSVSQAIVVTADSYGNISISEI